jgi:putative ABC transport system permease protein
MFDLEKEINAWLKQFRRHRAFDHGSIREMELHLRDHIDDLIADGVPAEEAFQRAVKAFGEIPDVAREEFQNMRPARKHFLSWRHSMLGNYLKIASRNFTKQPFFTLLNTFGLAIGISGGLLITLFIHDELSFDKMFTDADRIHRINIDNRTNGESSSYACAPGPMGGVLKEDCPQVELVTRFREVDGVLLRQTDATLNVKEKHVTAVDSSFFTMFGLALVEGNVRTALREPNTLVLTESAVRRHFGSGKALGKSMLVNNEKMFLVTGVMKDLPRNSFLRNHSVFISLTSYEDEKTLAWNTWYFPTFVKLRPGTRVEDLQVFLTTVKDNYLIPWAMTFVPGLTLENSRAKEKETGDYMRFNSTALTDIHLHSANRESEFSPNSGIGNVYIMALIGLFLVVLASVNFMNLSTAYSLTRSKEVGIRKTLGANRLGIIRQFLAESAVISLLSLGLSIGIASLALPFFNRLAEKEIVMPFANPLFWLALLAATMLLGLVSGGYPAFFMSKFSPSTVLKRGHENVGGGRVRNALVVFQFAVSVFLIVCTLVVYQQVNYIRHKDLGFRKDQVLVLDDISAAGNQVESLRDEISRLSQVENVSLSSYLPTPSARGATTYFLEGAIGKDEFKAEKAIIIEKWRIDYDYVPTLDLKIVAGRNFDRSFGADSSALLLNESAVKMLGITPEAAIGLRMTADFHRPDKENMEYLTIVGVVKNFHFESMRNSIDALSLVLGKKANRMMIRLKADNFASAIANIGQQWNKVAPGQPFNYYFMDDSFNDTYKDELRLGRIFITFTMLSLCIACLGLFGLATFSAEKRSREIGIRRVMGASVSHIAYKLSIDFLKLVAIAILVSLPLSWFVMNRWLEEFSYRADIGLWTLIAAALIAAVISLATVSYQSIRAALANPVKNLQVE